VAGFSDLVAYGSRPYRGVVTTVASVVAAQRDLGNEAKGVVLGVHRRYQEGLCPRRIGQYRFHECHPSAGAASPDVPLGTYCNVTLNATQAAFYLEHSSALAAGAASKAVVLFLATDYQDYNGDVAILQGHSSRMGIVRTAQLQRIDAGCFNARALSWRMMLMDSWALALADVHVGNPLSSCDTLVSHWRVALGRDAPSSFPQRCYAGFYDKKTVPEPERKPKF